MYAIRSYYVTVQLLSVSVSVSPPILQTTEPEHSGDLSEGDLDADTCQKADEDGPRHEIREEAELNKACKQQETGGQQGQEARQSDILGGPGNRAE